MLYASSVGAVATFATWAHAAPSHPCASLTMLPGLLMCLACASVPLFGMRNALHFWPAHRSAMIISGVLQFARTSAQAHASHIADAAAALGLSELLPMPVAVQCQAHPLFLPGGVSQPAALCFGCLALLTGITMKAPVRTRLSMLSGRFGLPTARARVLHCDGILLE